MSAAKPQDRLESIGVEPEDYGFTFDAHPGKVKVEFNGVTIADSDRVRVMRETRLAPVFYFPRDDLNWTHLQASEHRTYCPFKGKCVLLDGECFWTTRGECRLEL